MRILKYGIKESMEKKVDAKEELRQLQQKRKGKKKKAFVIPNELIHPEVLHPERNKLLVQSKKRLDVARQFARGLIASPNSVITASIIKIEKENKAKLFAASRGKRYIPEPEDGTTAVDVSKTKFGNQIKERRRTREEVFFAGSNDKYTTSGRKSGKMLGNETVTQDEVVEEEEIDPADLEELLPKKKIVEKKAVKVVKKKKRVSKADPVEAAENVTGENIVVLPDIRFAMNGISLSDSDESRPRSAQVKKVESGDVVQSKQDVIKKGDELKNEDGREESSGSILPVLTKSNEISSRPKTAKRPVESTSVFIPSRKPSGNKTTIKKVALQDKPVFVVEESYEDDDDGFTVDPLVSVDFKLASGYIWNLIRLKKGMQLHSAIVDILNDRVAGVRFRC
jgi:hypothetical protein